MEQKRDMCVDYGNTEGLYRGVCTAGGHAWESCINYERPDDGLFNCKHDMVINHKSSTFIACVTEEQRIVWAIDQI